MGSSDGELNYVAGPVIIPGPAYLDRQRVYLVGFERLDQDLCDAAEPSGALLHIREPNVIYLWNSTSEGAGKGSPYP